MVTFSALQALCAGNSPVTDEFPAQRAVTRSFSSFFDLRLNQQLSKQCRRWWFETPLCWLWRHCNGMHVENNSYKVWLQIIEIVKHNRYGASRTSYEKESFCVCAQPMRQSVTLQHRLSLAGCIQGKAVMSVWRRFTALHGHHIMSERLTLPVTRRLRQQIAQANTKQITKYMYYLPFVMGIQWWSHHFPW